MHPPLGVGVLCQGVQTQLTPAGALHRLHSFFAFTTVQDSPHVVCRFAGCLLGTWHAVHAGWCHALVCVLVLACGVSVTASQAADTESLNANPLILGPSSGHHVIHLVKTNMVD